ncbi:hypothetical protein GOODEAATRI_027107, partial [Goodea atripinnis]
FALCLPAFPTSVIGMLACASYGVPLQVEDGHYQCPKCLGMGHLREALTDPCMNCSILPLSVRENRLRQVENLPFAAELPPSGMPQPCSGRQGDAPAEERHSPRRKRPRLERPSRQEIDSLRAEVEQLKALLKAPEPMPAFQAAAAWELGEDLEDDGISVRPPIQSFSLSRARGTPSQTLGIGRGIPRVLEEMMAQVIPSGVQLAWAQGRNHARYRQLFW